MTGLLAEIEVDSEPGARPGYRLDRLEVLNWGTFDQRVFRLTAGGENTLLTGDIGSGKSTLVDAVTTLLLPANRINYNKAAGADIRERDLRSYVLGHYKSARVESTGVSRPVGLRDQNSFSVVLAVFANVGYGAEVTLAQVFWMRDTNQGQPLRFYVVAERGLSIAEHFSDFGNEIGGLKRRLRGQGADVYDHFPEYGTRMRRLLGISSEQALELLHQTISMKSVGNLTDFVRQHMLEGADTTSRIKVLVDHFHDLSRAHDSVRRARDQLEQLTPLVATCDEHDTLARRVDQFRLLRQALPGWIAGHRLALLRTDADRIAVEQAAVAGDRDRMAGLEDAEQAELQRLRSAREGAGGARIGELERLIEEEGRRRDERRARAQRHGALLDGAGLPAVTDAESFARNITTAHQRREGATSAVDDATNRRTELAVDGQQAQRESDELNQYLRSLRDRPTNIDQRSLAIREQLTTALAVPDDQLPFAGELIQVRPEHAEWQGAAERVLRGFALSLLIPAQRYEQATRWINDHHLKGRLVFYRVSPRITRDTPTRASDLVLADLLEVKAGPFAEWLGREVARRANLVCAADLAEFGRHDRAVTRQGLVKSGGGRNEKDDRFQVDDRTRWVLGWTNQDKIEALLHRGAELQRQLSVVKAETDQVARREEVARTVISNLDRLSEYQAWAELDWRASVTAVNRLTTELLALQEGNEQLAAITTRLNEVSERLVGVRSRLEQLTQRLGGLRQQQEDNERAQQETLVVVDAVAAEAARLAPALEALSADFAAPQDIASCDRLSHRHSADITARIDADATRQKVLGERAVRGMERFRQTWPTETTEMDADLASAAEFRTLLDRISGDDLPRFEAEFKRQLNTNTIRDIASFQAWLNQSAGQIRDRIELINSSLEAIDYNPGRLITPINRPTTHQEIRDFREELRACTDDALVEVDRYSEDRFLLVKKIVERFVGREGQTEADRRWTNLVTDVRNWYEFAASERFRDTGEEWEHYTDSDGKSGGQKEKLAYTVLAASLAYQFRLEWGVTAAKDFRFAVIDEAFGRGSNDSTRYALELFGKLGLQLLIVTPLQKVQVIEPYVRAVGFVENRSGDRSRLQTLTIEDFKERRAEFVAASKSTAMSSDG